MKKLKVIKVGLEKSLILQGIETLEAQLSATLKKILDYSLSKVLQKVLWYIPSYTDHVYRIGWIKL